VTSPADPAAPRTLSAAASLRSARALDITIRLCAILWSVWLMVPWDPAVFAQGPLDAGYTIFSHIAFAEGRPWGSGALHTSGPLGFLRFPFFYHPTYAILLLGAAALGTTLALLLDEVARRGLPSWPRLLFVVAVTWILSFNEEAVWLLVLLMSQVLIPDLTRHRQWSLRPDARWLTWPILLNLAACAIAANTKGTLLLMSGVVAAELAALELSGRRAPVLSLTFVLSVVLVARLSGFRFSDWGPYAHHIIDSLRGYPESFSLAGSPMQAALLVLSVLLFLTLAAWTVRQSASRLDAIIRLGALAILLWMVAKGALIRQDRPHEIRALLSLGVLFTVYLVAHRREWGLRATTVRLLPTLGLVAIFLLIKPTPSPAPPTTERHLDKFTSFLKEGPAAAVARDRQARRAVASEIKSPWPPTSSIAVFGTYQSLVLGHPGRHVALPIVAPYEIWSPWTSRREREFLMGPAAPDYLIYTASPTSAELALTLTARYAEIERGPRHRLLRLRPVPLTVTKRVVFEGHVEAGDTIEIPSAWRTGPAVAEVRYTKTFTNALISALYQPPEAFLVLFRMRTPFAKIRMNGLLSAEGVALSSQPGDWDSRPLALHGIRFGLLTDERVEATALGFEATGAAGPEWKRYFRPRIHLRIYIAEFR